MPLLIAATSYFSSSEILACHEAGISVTLPKPTTSSAKSEGRFGKQDFVYLPEKDAYRCPAEEQLPYRFTITKRNRTMIGTSGSGRTTIGARTPRTPSG
jgi:hypothetical protein